MTASGMQLPAAISSAIAANKTAYFEPSYVALRDRLLAQLAAGEKPELTANQWTPVTVGRLAAAVAVAEGALDAAKDRAAWLHDTALRSLVTELVLLLGALALALGAQIIVARRVITPLHNMALLVTTGFLCAAAFVFVLEKYGPVQACLTEIGRAHV